MGENFDIDGIRVNKYLSQAGLMSRREADTALDEGRVRINDKTAKKGDRILPGDMVYLDGKKVIMEDEKVILLFNKPRGITCTSQKNDKYNIIDFVNYPIRVYNVGRLDKESRGLILLTNRGELVNPLSKASNYHEKEYIVRVDHEINDLFIEKMRKGIYLEELDVITRSCKVVKTGDKEFKIVLTQGLNRQIRRMCKALGYRVTDLKRLRIMNLTVDGIPEGKYREILPEEEEELYRLLKLKNNK